MIKEDNENAEPMVGGPTADDAEMQSVLDEIAANWQRYRELKAQLEKLVQEKQQGQSNHEPPPAPPDTR